MSLADTLSFLDGEEVAIDNLPGGCKTIYINRDCRICVVFSVGCGKQQVRTGGPRGRPLWTMSQKSFTVPPSVNAPTGKSTNKSVTPNNLGLPCVRNNNKKIIKKKTISSFIHHHQKRQKYQKRDDPRVVVEPQSLQSHRTASSSLEPYPCP